jgi:hypothetical protein
LPAKPRFPPEILTQLRKGMIIGLRAGRQPHRFIGLWMVVVEGRLFVRSWAFAPNGWHQVLLTEPQGVVQVGERQFKVRAVQTRSERLKQAVDRAYLEKYHTPGSIKYARDLVGKKSRATTTELVPLA